METIDENTQTGRKSFYDEIIVGKTEKFIPKKVKSIHTEIVNNHIDVLPVSVIDLEPSGKLFIRGETDHNKNSSRSSFSPFPKEIATICSQLFLRDSTHVFDPFAGWGERHCAVIKEGKKYSGYDLSPEAISFAKENFGVENILTNSLETDPPVHDGLLTCPPYYNLEKYEGNGLSNSSTWESFLNDLQSIFQKALSFSKKGSKYCIMAGDWRSKGIYYDLVFQIEKMMSNFQNVKPFDKIVVSRKGISKIKIMLPQAKRLGYTVKVHETLLVYEVMEDGFYVK
jgi:hypothetical protein